MLACPKRVEISHHTIKLLVGVIALSLGALTNYFAASPLPSISASYHEGGWPRDIFVGFLYAVSAFLFAYNGKSSPEMVLSKFAAIAAMGVAMFPCGCAVYDPIVPHLHGVFAAVMFGILVVFCYFFFQRARKKKKKYAQAAVRATIYALCGGSMLVAILLIEVDHFSGGAIRSKIPRLTFYGEVVALVSFGIAWLTASRILPVITNADLRESLSPFQEEKQSAS